LSHVLLEIEENVWFHAGGTVGCYYHYRDFGWIAFVGSTSRP